MGMAGTSAYSGSKAALLTLARIASTELAERRHPRQRDLAGPGRNAHPWKAGLAAETLKGFGEKVHARTLGKRFGAPEEIAKTALFLASPDPLPGRRRDRR